jgi:hypothetical protein
VRAAGKCRRALTRTCSDTTVVRDESVAFRMVLAMAARKEVAALGSAGVRDGSGDTSAFCASREARIATNA